MVTNYLPYKPLLHPPIFIIGAPRSGSTLLYQIMIEYYNFGYLSNLHCTFCGFPAFIEHFIIGKQKQAVSSYKSIHGRIKGQTAPSECGTFWYRFFRRKPQFVPLNEADPRKMKLLRGSIQVLGKVLGKPILFKNLMCSLRLEPLASVFPEALFIIIHRNEIDNAHSILEGRKNLYGNYSTWWSVEPPLFDDLRLLPPHEQVIQQIRHISDLIKCDSQKIGPERFFTIQYETFCDDTLRILKELDNFLASHNYFYKTYPANIPSYFERRTKIRIDLDLYQDIAMYVQNKNTAIKAGDLDTRITL